ncbi:MAG: flagellar assembly peptidoglycan hydrolase FlgJ [Nitrosomonadales bacterium]|nr:flagellar assembly peptidoglycan hydrolase FlgJ [Nitrosomonadales bacterium]
MKTLPNNVMGGLAADVKSLDQLKLQAKQSPDQALKMAAQQFEAVFLGMMMKSMRDASPQDGMFDNEQTKMFTSMLDQQMTQSMASRGTGLADMLVKQLSHSTGALGGGAVHPAPAAQPVAHAAIPSAYSEGAQQDFVKQMMPAAMQASQTTGIPPQLMIGQAALESGWGKREIRNADGTNSYNLFGIKAGSGWSGKVAEVMTTEYHNGVSNKQTEKFRSYGSYAEAFQDYARLLKDSPRYAGVLQQGDAQGFAQALQQAGYATDPNYADKLVRVIGKVGTLG